MPGHIRGGITIEAKSPKQPSYFFSFQLELAGLAFHLSWLFLFMYSFHPVGSEGATWNDAGSFTPLYLCSSAALIVTLLAFMVAGRRGIRALEAPALTITAMGLTAAGSALYYLGALAAPGALFTAAWTSGLLTGVGSGALAARWAWNFGGTPSATIMASVPSILAVTVVCCVTVPHLPSPAAAVIVSALPLGSGLSALRAGGSETPAPAAASTSATDKPRKPLFYLLLCGGIALLGVTLGITTESSMPLLALDTTTIFLISAAGAIFVGSGLVIARTPQASLSANLLVPLVIIVCFLVILASTQPQQLGRNIEAVGNVCLEMLFFAVLVVAARRFSMAAVPTFAAGRVTYALSNMAGSELTGRLAAGASNDLVLQLSSFALLIGIEVIMVAAVVVVVLPRRRGVTGQPRPDEGPRPQAAGASGAEGVLDEALLPQVAGAAGETEATADSAAEQSFPAAPSAAPGGRAPFQQRMAAFAQALDLTTRETEVAKQLVMGHSYGRIMQELYIAEGTVNYHARNIYAKAGVHSKQELIELFEAQTAPEDGGPTNPGR